MIAVDEDRPAARSFDLLNERVLTVAGIYGPNASGKSNVLNALTWLSRAVARSLRSWDDSIPRQPFKFQNGPSKPSHFGVEMMVDKVRYAYSVSLDDTRVLHEVLYSYPERRRRMLFEREGLNISFRRGSGATSGTRELLTETTLGLSAAMRLDERDIAKFGRQLTNIDSFEAHGSRTMFPWPGIHITRYSTRHLFYGSPDESDELGADTTVAKAMLQFADMGIGDVQVSEEVDEDGDLVRSLRLVHHSSEEKLAFDMRDESAGTQTWFRLIGPVLHALKHGRTLLFDEIDSSLHPRLSAKLVELFQDPDTNPRHAQLIFTSHDTSLLNHLNRDEVWLTEKGGDGMTTLTALAEYGGDKVRRSLNLERAYLQGRFGAVPEIDQAILRTVALDTQGE